MERACLSSYPMMFSRRSNRINSVELLLLANPVDDKDSVYRYMMYRAVVTSVPHAEAERSDRRFAHDVL